MATLKPTEELGIFERISDSRRIAQATHHTPDLETELPLTLINYGDWLHANHRLRNRASFIKKERKEVRKGALPHPTYLGFIVKLGKDAIGMASAEEHEPTPLPTDAKLKGRTVELSYWHRLIGDAKETRLSHDTMQKTGEDVIRHLAQVAKKGLDLEDDDTFWMVTMPDDEIKTSILDFQKFTPIGAPQEWAIGDDVTIERQLWTIPVRELTKL